MASICTPGVGQEGVASGGDGAGVMGDSATVVTSFEASKEPRASKRTRRIGDDAVPKMSPFSRSWHPIRGIDCRPEKMNCSSGFESF